MKRRRQDDSTWRRDMVSELLSSAFASPTAAARSTASTRGGGGGAIPLLFAATTTGTSAKRGLATSGGAGLSSRGTAGPATDPAAAAASNDFEVRELHHRRAAYRRRCNYVDGAYRGDARIDGLTAVAGAAAAVATATNDCSASDSATAAGGSVYDDELARYINHDVSTSSEYHVARRRLFEAGLASSYGRGPRSIPTMSLNDQMFAVFAARCARSHNAFTLYCFLVHVCETAFAQLTLSVGLDDRVRRGDADRTGRPDDQDDNDDDDDDEDDGPDDDFSRLCVALDIVVDATRFHAWLREARQTRSSGVSMSEQHVSFVKHVELLYLALKHFQRYWDFGEKLKRVRFDPVDHVYTYLREVAPQEEGKGVAVGERAADDDQQHDTPRFVEEQFAMSCTRLLQIPFDRFDADLVAERVVKSKRWKQNALYQTINFDESGNQRDHATMKQLLKSHWERKRDMGTQLHEFIQRQSCRFGTNLSSFSGDDEERAASFTAAQRRHRLAAEEIALAPWLAPRKTPTGDRASLPATSRTAAPLAASSSSTLAAAFRVFILRRYLMWRDAAATDRSPPLDRPFGPTPDRLDGRRPSAGARVAPQPSAEQRHDDRRSLARSLAVLRAVAEKKAAGGVGTGVPSTPANDRPDVERSGADAGAAGGARWSSSGPSRTGDATLDGDNLHAFQLFTKQRFDQGWLHIASEFIVYDVAASLAGSIDAIFAPFPRQHPNLVVLVDWKRCDIDYGTKYSPLGPNMRYTHPYTKQFPKANYWKYAFQLNLYRELFERMFEHRYVVVDMLIVSMPEHLRVPVVLHVPRIPEATLLVEDMRRFNRNYFPSSTEAASSVGASSTGAASSTEAASSVGASSAASSTEASSSVGALAAVETGTRVHQV